MFWYLLLAWMSIAGADVEVASHHDEVQVQSAFFGARFNTKIKVTPTHLSKKRTYEDVLAHNTRQLRDLNRWVTVSKEHHTFDDYGVFRLVIQTIDALPIERIQYRSAKPYTVSEALNIGAWTESDRILAIAGGLRALGYSVAVLEYEHRDLVLGLGTTDSDVNAASITVRWMSGTGRQTEPRHVEWLLWDGTHRIGHLTKLGSRPNLNNLTFLTKQRPSGHLFSFMSRVAPSFTRRTQSTVVLPVHGTRHSLRMHNYPEMARWFSLYPEFDFEQQVRFAEQDREWLQMGRSVRKLARAMSHEQEVIDALLRTIQKQFEYKIGPLRSMSEVVHSREADCDQMAMFMVIALLELGYSSKDIVAINWPEHLALGIRPKGKSPDGTSVRYRGAKYHVLDLTYYVYEDKVLRSSWGKVSPKYGAQVTVGALDALRKSGASTL